MAAKLLTAEPFTPKTTLKREEKDEEGGGAEGRRGGYAGRKDTVTRTKRISRKRVKGTNKNYLARADSRGRQ